MQLEQTLNRRHFLAAGGLAITSPLWAESTDKTSRLIKSIQQSTLWDNSDGKSTTWFHPRACMVPQDSAAPMALMTMQSITGSDYFGPVHWTSSDNLGQTWTEPKLVSRLGQRPVPEYKGLRQGVCDVVPEYHPQTKSVLALGHVVFYRGEKFSKQDQLSRYPIYSIRDASGNWSEARKLEWDDPRGSFIYTNNCGQRIVLPNGDILLAFTFGAESKNRSVAGVRCEYDGERLQILDVGPPLELNHGRGLLEPSVTQFQKQFYITIRAEDDRGYVSTSEDGLNWMPKKAWMWDNGEPLSMSTTQQHWLTHSEGLFLVYTRKMEVNRNVIRWRAPLLMARVDPQRMVLIRETEQVVHPLIGDGVKRPDEVPLMGNFHVTNASPHESWVTVGSWMPRRKAVGTVHLARIQWSQPNQLVQNQ
ncbi:sialidase family protein [Rubinisphaera italica]|uniref:Sialidase domain-containing protein n=1 Tax=Rubinisphaera italica TaxID=2527969 RepID=A0A5C5XFG5_9PLAN|nr:sialidase family protein [Rubinisphaera italica]TWT61534.1 hypothetical protein Pan54_22700 [Rubinisphaera italica]